VLRDRGLEGVMDVADPVPEDVLEAHEDGELDATQNQVIGELLEVDRLVAVLGGMDEHMAGRRDRKIPLAPPFHFVELTGVGGGKHLAGLPVTLRARRRIAHALMIQERFCTIDICPFSKFS
jgi:hypothetical protein